MMRKFTVRTRDATGPDTDRRDQKTALGDRRDISHGFVSASPGERASNISSNELHGIERAQRSPWTSRSTEAQFSALDGLRGQPKSDF
jgi:hypothetical protein